MRRVVVTGGPGAGKTTLLRELAGLGYPTVSDSAREVIAERLAIGLPPRPEPAAFAREILRRDERKYQTSAASCGFVFFDRSPLEAIAMVHDAAPMKNAELRAKVEGFEFHRTVLVLPPWREIYRTDTERDHSFEHAERVHEELLRWYRWCGYAIYEVPRLGVEERARHVALAFATRYA